MALKDLKTTVGTAQIYAKQWSATKAVKTKMLLLNKCKHFILPFMTDEYSFDDVLALLANVPEEDLLPIIKTVVYQVNIQTEDLEAQAISDMNFDQLFTGKLIDIYKIFGKVLALQYADFFAQGSELRL